MSFQQDILRWQRKAEAAMEATVKDAAQELSLKANTSRFKGGNTPVDTSFLINSFSGAVNSIPRGEGDKPNGYVATDFDAGPALLAINRLKLGDRLVLGWTANYAMQMEAKYGFMRSAAQQWPQIAEKSARKVRRALG
jgi:hypothetical protein